MTRTQHATRGFAPHSVLSAQYSVPFPFPAIIGHGWAKTALLLLAVEPRLGGVLIAAGPGTGKSTLAHAFHALRRVPSAERQVSSMHDQADASDASRKHLEHGTWHSALPFVELPLNATIDRVAGGLDLEASLRRGERVAVRGLLAEAHGGTLVVDGVNLLDAGITNLVMAAMGSGQVRVEREGISREDPAVFALIGTYDPAEGAVRSTFADRAGLVIAPQEVLTAADRAEIVRRAEHFRRDPVTFAAAYAAETDALAAQVAAARERLPRVRLDDACAAALAETAAACGVPGNRADVFAARAALAAAALDGRDDVTDDDLRLVVRLVLLPRATRLPQPETEEPPPPPPPEPPPPDPPEDRDDPAHDAPETDPTETPQGVPNVEDLVLAALAGVAVPEDVLTVAAGRGNRRGASGSRGAMESRRRGRVVGTVAGEARAGRISIPATLVAAAPMQRERGRVVGGRPVLTTDDVRLKRYREKAGTLFIFCTDASGSMALNRMRAAKGAVTSLLGQAYVHRDKVALIAFRGARADVLLPPSQGVERAKRALDVLPTGGGTPLASALLLAHRMAAQAQTAGTTNVLLVLITDGRANVPLAPDAPEEGAARRARASREVQALARRWHAAGWGAAVIDTQVSFTSKGEAAGLARHLGGRYLFLPGAKATEIAAAVSAAADATRG